MAWIDQHLEKFIKDCFPAAASPESIHIFLTLGQFSLILAASDTNVESRNTPSESER